MTAAMSRVLVVALGIALAGCANGPVSPSLENGAFLVVLKGDLDRLKDIQDQVRPLVDKKPNQPLPPCLQTLDTTVNESSPFLVENQIVYECGVKGTSPSNIEALAEFSKAYETTSQKKGAKGPVIEMKLTTTGGCQNKSCPVGAPTQAWRVPCLTPC